MEDKFLLLVSFQGKKMRLPCKLIRYGNIHKLEVSIEGTQVFFEPDEERNWRAFLTYKDVQANKKLSVELLKAIAETIEETLK
jgi:hypothetical protein